MVGEVARAVPTERDRPVRPAATPSPTLIRRHGVGWPWITSCCSELYQAASTARAATTIDGGELVVPAEEGREPGRDGAPNTATVGHSTLVGSTITTCNKRCVVLTCRIYALMRCIHFIRWIYAQTRLSMFRERLDEAVRRTELSRSAFAAARRRRPNHVDAIALADEHPPAPPRHDRRTGVGARVVGRLADRSQQRRSGRGRDHRAHVVRGAGSHTRRRTPPRLARRGGGLQDPIRPLDAARPVEDRRRHPLRTGGRARAERGADDRDERRPPDVGPPSPIPRWSAARRCRGSPGSHAARAPGAG